MWSTLCVLDAAGLLELSDHVIDMDRKSSHFSRIDELRLFNSPMTFFLGELFEIFWSSIWTLKNRGMDVARGFVDLHQNHVYPSGRFLFVVEIWVKPVQGPDSSWSPPTFLFSRQFDCPAIHPMSYSLAWPHQFTCVELGIPKIISSCCVVRWLLFSGSWSSASIRSYIGPLFSLIVWAPSWDVCSDFLIFLAHWTVPSAREDMKSSPCVGTGTSSGVESSSMYCWRVQIVQALQSLRHKMSTFR